MTSVGDVCVVRAAATILPGQEVSDNYGHYFQVKPKVYKTLIFRSEKLPFIQNNASVYPQVERQRDLKVQYFFDCDCLACRDDWPVYRNLNPDPSIICPGKYKSTNAKRSH